MSEFSTSAFIKRGLLAGVGKGPSRLLLKKATEWKDSGVFTADDVEEIETAIQHYEEARIAEQNRQLRCARTQKKQELLTQIATGEKAETPVILYAAKLMKEGVLTTEDLAEIEAEIDAKKGER